VSVFVDTYVFIRAVTKDDLAKARDCFALFRRARRGDIELHTSEAIVAEVIFVLTSRRIYSQPRRQVARALGPFLENPVLRIDHKQFVVAAVARWAQSNLDFEDCLAIEHAIREDGGDLYSDDRDLDGIAGIQRLEP
jgi:predicted nucleic acid-binding protein